MMRSLFLAVLMLGSGFASAGIPLIAKSFDEKKAGPSVTDPKAEQKSKRVIRYPKSLDPVKPVNPPSPSPKPDPYAAIKLGSGQFYVIGSNVKLVVNENAGLKLTGAGSVSITERKPPLTVPAEIAVGTLPDPSDPEVVTFNEPYLYIVKPRTIEAGPGLPKKIASGPVVLQLIPAENETITDKDGKSVLVPLTAADIEYLPIDVGSGQGPQPPPNPKPDPIPDPKPKPPVPDVDAALLAKFKAAIAKDLAIKGTVATKEHITKLAGVYETAARFVTFDDPAARPKTWKQVQQSMVEDSRMAEVPPLPEFVNLRTVIETVGGTYDATTPIDDAFGKKLNATFTKIAAALTEAAK